MGIAVMAASFGHEVVSFLSAATNQLPPSTSLGVNINPLLASVGVTPKIARRKIKVMKHRISRRRNG